MTTVRLTLWQLRFTNKAFWRNSAAAVFTCVFPVIFLILLGSLFGGKCAIGGTGDACVTTATGVVVPAQEFYVPTMIVFAVVSACFTNIAMSVTIQRDAGQLKRLRGTPLPPSAYIGARSLHAAGVSVLLMIGCCAIGAVMFGAPVPNVFAAAAALLIGAVSFCALGLAMTAVIPDAHSASPIVNAVILPVLLISDVFVPPGHLPAWLNSLAEVLPVLHLSRAMQAAFFPGTFEWEDLAVVAAWGVLGAFVAVKRFSWEPRL